MLSGNVFFTALYLLSTSVAAKWAQQAPSTIPAGFRPAYEQNTVCNSAFYRINFAKVTNCTQLDLSGSSHSSGLTILMCPDAQNWAVGSVVFLDDDVMRTATTRVYRARLSGPEVLLLPVHYCSTSLAVATFSITIPGNFSLELLQLYSNFSYQTVTPLHQDMKLTTTSFTVDSTDPKTVGNANCVGSACPLCRTADTPGRWLVKPELAATLAKTCPPSEPFCHQGEGITAVPQSIDDSLVRWQPYGCTFRSHSEHMECRNRIKGVCFFGDSQMRHVYNAFVEPSFNLDAHWYYTDKSRIHNDAANYTFLGWGFELHADNLTSCQTILVNFGQWPLSHMANETVVDGKTVNRPWDVGQWIQRVAEVAQVLQQAQQEGKRVWWVTIQSMPYLPRFVEMTDFRNDPYFLLFNSIAYEMMHRHGVPVVDTWTLSDTLKDLAYDQVHYKGWVGHWMAAAVAHEVCADSRPLHQDLATIRKLRHRRFHCHWQEYSIFLSARSGRMLCPQDARGDGREGYHQH